MSTGPTLRCFCGAVSQTLTAGPSGSVNCHCGQCRRLSGAAFTTWVSFPTSAIDLTAPALTGPAVRAFAVTPRVTRRFCIHCGSHLFTTDTRLPGIVGVPVGALEEAEVPSPKAHYFVDDSPAWTVFCDGLPQFGGESGMVLR